jgi:hypothetical protein
MGTFTGGCSYAGGSPNGGGLALLGLAFGLALAARRRRIGR